MTTYTVRPGDTLAHIAHTLYGTSRTWQELADAAGLDNPHLLEVGERLEFPDRWPMRPRAPLDHEIDFPFLEFGTLYPRGYYAGVPHPGVDMSQQFKSPVYAAGHGIVCVSRYDPQGYGYYVMIEHLTTTGGPAWTLYGHFYPLDLALPGDRVTAETVIGHEGKSGNSGGIPHVHFEVKRTPELGLYGRLTPDNLRDYYHSPREWLADPEVLIVPTQCWGCPGRGCV